MYEYIDKIIIYRKSVTNNLLADMGEIFRDFKSGNYDKEELTGRIYTGINNLLDIATDYGFNNNLWKCYVSYILAMSENPFTITCEKQGAKEGTVNEFVKDDLLCFWNILNYDFAEIENDLSINCFSRISNYHSLVKPERRFNKSVSDGVSMLTERLENAEDVDELYQVVTEFYNQTGVGKFGLNKAFRIKKEDSNVILAPITNTSNVRMKDIIGYDSQKKKLVENTESFLDGHRANNVLLCGDSGTGKSTSIKALLNEYYDRGLRMIEIYKHQFQDLSRVLEMIKDRNYKFIIYMDDLSFEEFEIEYKFLKAVIEGGLETKPDNVLIYATSNRRHLIRETWKDRDDRDEELHTSDTMQEKLSLAARFGLTIYYGRPEKKEFDAIVKGIASRYPDLNMTEEELLLEANKWSLTNGGFSGRVAEQMIISRLGM